MGTGRTFNKTSMTRPKKSVAERKRRVKVQRSRLVALGMDEEAVKRLDNKQLRELLRSPKKTTARLSAAKA